MQEGYDMEFSPFQRTVLVILSIVVGITLVYEWGTLSYYMATGTGTVLVTPAARRQAVAHAVETFGVSQRRACTVLAADRSPIRHIPKHDCGKVAVRASWRAFAHIPN
jgi:hypothetical protein